MSSSGSECADTYAAAGAKLMQTGAVIGPGIGFGKAGKLLLSFNSHEQRSQAADLLRDLRLSPGITLFAFRHLPILVVNALEVTPSLVQTLKSQLDAHGLLSIYPDEPLAYHLMDSADYIGVADARRNYSLSGRGIGVAVIDSGINEAQGDFENVGANIKIVGNPVADDPTLPQPPIPNTYLDVTGTNSDTSSGHGTHVAGTVGGTGAMSGGVITGMAPGATLIGLATGETIAVLYAVSAFDWIADDANRLKFNIRVTNNSYGPATPGAPFDPFHPINVATKHLYDLGVYTVFSAGNSGTPTDDGSISNLNIYSTSPCVISVAAGIANAHVVTPYNPLVHDNNIVFNIDHPAWYMDSGDARGQVAWFSSRGMKGDATAHPDITAPGDYVASAWGGATATAMFAGTGGPFVIRGGSDDPAWTASYWRSSGTSMAGPHIAGILALMLEADPSLTFEQILDVLTGTAVPMTRADGTPYELWEAGAGFVNVDAALARVVNIAPYNDLAFERVASFEGPVALAASIPDPTGLVGSVPLVESEARATFTIPPGADYKRLEIFVSWDNPLNDLDLYVLDADGVEAAVSGNFPPLFETAHLTSFAPDFVPAGTYTVIVRGFNNNDETFRGNVVGFRNAVR